MRDPAPCLIPRDSGHIYDISFPSKPLHITLTSSKWNTDGYITRVEEDCPVENAKEKIALNSKVTHVNGTLVEGCEVTKIATHLKNGEIPLKLTLVHPAGLGKEEVPDLEPETIVHMQDEQN
jgi:hypothetical protein